MATTDDAGPYREEFQPPAWAALQRLRERAVAGRQVTTRFYDLVEVRQRLRTDPAGWGDPLDDYHQLGLTRYRGLSVCLCVYFSVLAETRTVVIQHVEANPLGPLA